MNSKPSELSSRAALRMMPPRHRRHVEAEGSNLSVRVCAGQLRLGPLLQADHPFRLRRLLVDEPARQDAVASERVDELLVKQGELQAQLTDLAQKQARQTAAETDNSRKSRAS